jgi:hypothetical protein
VRHARHGRPAVGPDVVGPAPVRVD